VSSCGVLATYVQTCGTLGRVGKESRTDQ
jgi:hypothetical protein